MRLDANSHRNPLRAAHTLEPNIRVPSPPAQPDLLLPALALDSVHLRGPRALAHVLDYHGNASQAQFTLNFAGRRPGPAPAFASRFLRDEAEDQSAYEDDDEESSAMDFDVPLNDADVSGSFELEHDTAELDFEEQEQEPRKVEQTQGEETREVLKRSLRNRDVVVVSPVLAKTPRQAARQKSRDVLGETQG